MIDYSDDDVVAVVVSGDIGNSRSVELWSALEEALHQAIGRLVAADLSEVTSFDRSSIQALTEVATASARRHVDLCAVVRPLSVLNDHLTFDELGGVLPIYPNVSAALSATAGAAFTEVPSGHQVSEDYAPAADAELPFADLPTAGREFPSPRSVQNRRPPSGRPDRAEFAHRG